MYNQDEIIKERIDRLSEKYMELRENFKKVKSKLEAFTLTPLTKQSLAEYQYIIDDFLEQNNLNISVYVTLYENNRVICLGRTIIDEIVWECIQKD